ncbi:MAG TPA: thiamine pyrophosphate-requiring protein [Alphaproteobacteria bacterium]|nr:thiamine pyrophosphate-requiring protein [Alphaproteobacteria bacterium]
MTKTTLPATTVAEAYLALLRARGVDYLFANSGTDFPSIVEALARAPQAGLKLPEAMVVPHENAAMGMAHGYYMVSGRPQAVMVHVTVGTANGICALMNAARENVPIFFTAGRTPILESGKFGARNGFIHWGQEMFDQGGMVRELVKWEYELRNGQQVEAVVDRALALAMTEPRGPIYLSLPREALAETVDGFAFDAQPRMAPPAPAYPDPAAIERAAALLAKAEFPIIVTTRAARDPDTFAALTDLAERFALPVVEYRARYNALPSDHPMHLGYDYGPWVEAADAALVLDSDVPWVPALPGPKPDIKVVQIGPDPLFGDYPVRSFPAEIAITSRVPPALDALSEALAEATKGKKGALEARYKKIAALHLELRAKARKPAEGPQSAPMNAAWVSHCIDKAKDDDTIVVSELGVVPPVMTFTRPGTYFNSGAAGGLGWGLPAALGAKLAVRDSGRDRTVIATIGDGSYMFANPVACHQVGEAQRLPVLTIVFNNARWHAVRRATAALYPQGHALRSNTAPLTSLEPSPAYEKVIEASGGYGERVADPAELPKALDRALDAVRGQGRQALLNVIVD